MPDDISPQSEPVTPQVTPEPQPTPTPEPIPSLAPESTEEPLGAEPKKGAEKRINQLVGQREAARREADYWRGIAEGKAKPDGTPIAPPPPTSAPQISQFENYDDFLVAKAKYEIRQEDQTKSQQQFFSDLNTQHESRMNAALTEDPEIMEISRDPTLAISPIMAIGIKQSEVGPKIIRYLSEHRDEAIKIMQMPPFSAGREILRIEAKFLTPPPPKTTEPKIISQAPKPIETVTPKGQEIVEEANLPMSEFVARRNKKQYPRGRLRGA